MNMAQSEERLPEGYSDEAHVYASIAHNLKNRKNRKYRRFPVADWKNPWTSKIETQ
jgi:hypothetical protein